mmetsp:Transcript_77672/g.227764  ORF Transcript_77672/g.227764 Transcript_77672/m.227764 type:complete len:321 (+) Transcript_77672:655-1617(+)
MHSHKSQDADLGVRPEPLAQPFQGARAQVHILNLQQLEATTALDEKLPCPKGMGVKERCLCRCRCRCSRCCCAWNHKLRLAIQFLKGPLHKPGQWLGYGKASLLVSVRIAPRSRKEQGTPRLQLQTLLLRVQFLVPCIVHVLSNRARELPHLVSLFQDRLVARRSNERLLKVSLSIARVVHPLKNRASTVPRFCGPPSREQQSLVGCAESLNQAVANLHERRALALTRVGCCIHRRPTVDGAWTRGCNCRAGARACCSRGLLPLSSLPLLVLLMRQKVARTLVQQQRREQRRRPVVLFAPEAKAFLLSSIRGKVSLRCFQ